MHGQRGIALGVSLAVALLAGCTGLNGGLGTDGQRHGPLPDDDIFKVVCFFPPNMWQSFDAAGDLNPEGFAFVMYLLSRKTGVGALAKGDMNVKIFRLVRGDGETERILVFEQTAPVPDLARRPPSKLGESYQPAVWWGDLDIYGQEVQIVIQYRSPAGRIIQSQTLTKKVPMRKK